MKVLKRHKTSLVLISVLVMLWLTNMNAGNAGISFPILDYAPNAKAMGMGNAYTSLCDDVTSVYYNPSGLASLYHTELYWTYEKLHLNSASWMAGLGFHRQNVGSFGFAVNYFGNNSILKTNDNKELSDLYSSSHLLLLAGFGQHYKGRNKLNHPYFLDVGITLKLLKHSILQHISYGFGFDVGLKIIPKPSTLLKDFLFGFTVQNAIKLYDETSNYPAYLIPSSMKKIDDSGWYYPKTKFGITYFAWRKALSFNADLSKSYFIDTPVNYNFGIAYKILQFLELRAGYFNGYSFGMEPDFNSISFGMGLDFNGVAFNSGFNYNPDYGLIGQFDLTLKFF